MSNRKSRLGTFNVVVLVIAVLQQASAFYGMYLFRAENGTATEYINEFVMSIPFYAVLYLGVPLLIRRFVNKGPVKRKEGIGISIALLIVLYLVHLMIYSTIGLPVYFGLDIAITFTLIGHIFLTIPQKTKTSLPKSDSNAADVPTEESPGEVQGNCFGNNVCINTEAISFKEEPCINTFKELPENKILKADKKPKKRLTIICIVVIAIVAIVSIVLYCNYDNWKLQRIETKLTTTTAIKDGDIDVLLDLRESYISYGGDVATFDRLIQEDIEREFINAIDAKDEDKYLNYNEYLSEIGYTSDSISELICRTSLADTFQMAIRTNNEDLAIDTLTVLVSAGLTHEYYEILYIDALR